MAERKALLGLLQARLRRAEERQDDSLLLDPAALTESRRLIRLLDDQDVKPRLVVGWLHWNRYLALPEGQGEEDLATAADMFTFCFVHDARDEVLPEPLLPHLADNSVGIALAMLERALESTEPAVITAATRIWRRILTHTPTDDPNRAVYLGNLQVALQLQFGRFGALTYLDEAVTVGRQIVQAAPTDHPDRARYLSNLGAALQTRFHRTGTLADLDEAIAVSRQAVDATPLGHPDLAGRLSNLGAALARRFHRTGTLADLDEAIAVSRQALHATPADHSDRVSYLSNLGGVLRARFLERPGTAADLDEAITVGRQAVRATPLGHPDLAIYQSNLGNLLQIRFDESGTLTDLDEAITVGRQAVRATPADHPNRAGYLRNLGVALHDRFDRSGIAADREEAVQALVTAAGIVSAEPSVRVTALRAAGVLRATTSDRERAARLLENAVRLLPEVAPRGLDRPDQQVLLSELAGLAGDAAALVLAGSSARDDKRAGRALALLESGRALLLAQVMEVRDDLTDLRAQHPDVAQRFAELRDLLDQPSSSSLWSNRGADDGSGPVQDREDREAGDRRRMAAELRVLLEQIRLLEGFASFALPPAEEELRRQAGTGPVVTFNVTDYRSDALLLTEHGITAIPLPGLTPDAVIDRINAFHQALVDSTAPDPDADRGTAQQQVREILAWLWDAAVGPVLDALGFSRTPADGQEWPRVWWAPGGLLSLLPLHAAGHHTRPDDADYQTRTALDRVVSSYTPTIAALRYARQHTTPLTAQAQTLIVAMPSTPGLQHDDRLPEVTREAAQLKARLPHPVLLTEPDPATGAAATEDQIPTRAAVFARLAEVTIAHFACHGSSHPTDPSQSMLLLHDWQHDPLTVASLAPVNLDHARLAYLSACSTTLTWNQNLLDESIHLTAAFQLAGFPHVIGTLWEVDDTHAADIADTFYTHLTDTNKNINTDHAAHALHATIRSLRDRFPLTPSLWAAHLHAGA